MRNEKGLRKEKGDHQEKAHKNINRFYTSFSPPYHSYAKYFGYYSGAGKLYFLPKLATYEG